MGNWSRLCCSCEDDCCAGSSNDSGCCVNGASGSVQLSYSFTWPSAVERFGGGSVSSMGYRPGDLPTALSITVPCQQFTYSPDPFNCSGPNRKNYVGKTGDTGFSVTGSLGGYRVSDSNFGPISGGGATGCPDDSLGDFQAFDTCLAAVGYGNNGVRSVALQLLDSENTFPATGGPVYYSIGLYFYNYDPCASPVVYPCDSSGDDPGTGCYCAEASDSDFDYWFRCSAGQSVAPFRCVTFGGLGLVNNNAIGYSHSVLTAYQCCQAPSIICTELPNSCYGYTSSAGVDYWTCPNSNELGSGYWGRGVNGSSTKAQAVVVVTDG